MANIVATVVFCRYSILRASTNKNTNTTYKSSRIIDFSSHQTTKDRMARFYRPMGEGRPKTSPRARHPLERVNLRGRPLGPKFKWDFGRPRVPRNLDGSWEGGRLQDTTINPQHILMISDFRLRDKQRSHFRGFVPASAPQNCTSGSTAWLSPTYLPTGTTLSILSPCDALMCSRICSTLVGFAAVWIMWQARTAMCRCFPHRSHL